MSYACLARKSHTWCVVTETVYVLAHFTTFELEYYVREYWF